VRATLHEELMREAGFEMERDQDLERRRERRRARLGWIPSLVGIVLGGTIAAILTELTEPHRHYVLAVLLAVSLSLLYAAVHWVVVTWRDLEKADRERQRKGVKR
jgi:hypothetical protein